MAWTLFWVLMALSLPWMLRKSFPSRVVIFFVLLAFADWTKRLVFLASDQVLWSQYAVYLLPYLYYLVVLLVPWGLARLQRGLPRAEGWLWIFILLMLGNTWLRIETSITAKLAATALLILPWMMVALIVDYPKAIVPTWRVLVIIGVLNAFYALWHFLGGPTPIELRWAQATSEFSIGADHLAAFLENRYGGTSNVWRPIGFQSDSFTLALFCLNAFAMAWMLREQRKISLLTFFLVSGFLLGGILLSLVRTIWVTTLGMIVYAFLGRRWHSLGRPRTILIMILALFVVSALLSAFLYSFMWLAGTIGNPILARALTFGTLEARMGSLTAFVESLPRFLLTGYGMAASPWITSKFGGFGFLPPNFGNHNVVVEYLWYLGLPGVVLLFLLFYLAAQSVWKAYREGKVSAGFMSVASAYLLAMFTSGLGNGGVFLNMFFFFMLGAMFGLSKQRENR